MKIRIVFLCLSFLLIGIANIAFAGDLKEITEKFEAKGVDKVRVNLDFGAGELSVGVADFEEVAALEAYYDSRKVRIKTDYYTRGNTGYLELESDFRKRYNHEDFENEWDLVLSERYLMELDMDIGACETEIDLGGLQLQDLTIDIGAASADIEFSKPNKTRMKRLSIDVGAAELILRNFGNANFKKMDLSVGAASCELDLRGKFSDDAFVDIEVGVGSAEITLPQDMAVRIEGDDNWFSSVDFHGLDLDEVDDDIWESDDYDTAPKKLLIVVEVALGSVDFYAGD